MPRCYRGFPKVNVFPWTMRPLYFPSLGQRSVTQDRRQAVDNNSYLLAETLITLGALKATGEKQRFALLTRTHGTHQEKCPVSGLYTLPI
jgi:hypothetical protein